MREKRYNYINKKKGGINMNKLFILNFWYRNGYGDVPIILSTRSDAEEMALAIHQEHLYESFLCYLIEDEDTVEDAVKWAYDDVVAYSIKEAVALL